MSRSQPMPTIHQNNYVLAVHDVGDLPRTSAVPVVDDGKVRSREVHERETGSAERDGLARVAEKRAIGAELAIAIHEERVRRAQAPSE